MTDYVISAFLFFVIVIVAGAIGGFMAADRGRNVLLWSPLCALVPPFLVLLYFMKPLCEVEGRFRKCANCGEFIQWHAQVCKHCHARQSKEIHN